MLGGGEIHEIHSEYSEHKLHNVKKKKNVEIFRRARNASIIIDNF